MAEYLILSIVAFVIWLAFGSYTLAKRSRVDKFDYSICWLALMVQLANQIVQAL